MKLSVNTARRKPELEYIEAGTGSTLFFLHGISGNTEIWCPQLGLFSNKFRAIGWNARGYGNSKAINHTIDFSEFAKDLYRLTKHLRLEKINLCGHSMRGRIALDVAERFPEIVNSLILLNTFFTYDKKFSFKQRQGFLLNRRKLLIEDGLTLEEFGLKIILQMLGKNASGATKLKILNTRCSLNISSYINAVESMVMYEKVCNLESLSVPTLILAGARDTIPPPPAIALKMNDRIENSVLIMIESIGLCLNLEEPQLFNGNISKFLSKIK